MFIKRCFGNRLQTSKPSRISPNLENNPVTTKLDASVHPIVVKCLRRYGNSNRSRVRCPSSNNAPGKHTIYFVRVAMSQFCDGPFHMEETIIGWSPVSG